MASTFRINAVSKVVLKQHRHALPTCTSATHSPSCASYGREAKCTRVIKGVNKVTGRLEFEALCTHLIF
jgi:hypothetical protein